MVKAKVLTKYFLIFVLLSTSHLDAVSKGSDAVVSIEPYFIFPSADTDNNLLSFGLFKNGFGLEDSLTTCTFSSIFPVSGRVSLRGGTLYLNSDLRLTGSAIHESFGRIYGNHNILAYDANLTHFEDPQYIGHMSDINLVTNADLTLSGTVRFDGDCSFCGNGRRINLSSGTNIIIGPHSSLWVKNAKLVGLQDSNIRCLDATGKIIFDDVLCIMSDSYTFSVGSMEYYNQVGFTGSYTFYYESNQTSTIYAHSKINIADGMTIAVGALGTQTTQKPFNFVDRTSKLGVENANFVIGPCGLQLTTGTLDLFGKVAIDIFSTSTANGLILGDGTDEGNVKSMFNAASYVMFKSGHLTYWDTIPDGVESKSIAAKVVREAANTMHLKKNMLYKDMTIKVDPTSPLTVENGAQALYDNCKFDLPFVKFVISGSRYNTYTSLLSGDGELFMQEGTYPLYLLVAGTGNAIRGNGNLTGGIILSGPTATLNFNLDGQVLNNITLNGGTLYLDHDLEMGHDNMLLKSGTVNMGGNDLVLGTNDLNWTSTIYWSGADAGLYFKSIIYLTSTWTFSGDCTIDGGNNILFLMPTGNIVVERGSSLTLRNMRLGGLVGNNIRCLDDAGHIEFDNVISKLYGDFNFEKGSFAANYYWEIKGDYFFSYKSSQVSTINHCSYFKLSSTTFSYEPPVPERQLLSMATDESRLYLKGSSLCSTATGMQLTKGALEIEGNCYVQSDATIKSNGVIFGDGLSADNNLTVDVHASSQLELTSGYLVYKNIS